MRADFAERMELPFFDDEHRVLAKRLQDALRGWQHLTDDASAPNAGLSSRVDANAVTRLWVRRLGEEGWLRHCVPARWGGARTQIDSRTLCIVRELLAYHDGLADFAFAMQGLGSGAIALDGTDTLREEWLPRVADGSAIAAFALSEPDAGSDVGALRTAARRDGDHWIINGTKTWISNGGIADFYCVFARTDASLTGARGIDAFVVPAHTPGFDVSRRIDVIAPHPLATLTFNDCRIPDTNRLGTPGTGFKLAMRTLDIFRVSVAAAALGFARRAIDETLSYTTTRAMFGNTLADQPLAQSIIGDMQTEFDAAALLTARAAWLRDMSGVRGTTTRTTAQAAMAKLAATEWGSRIVDQAVQLHGARGVETGAVVERLYREVRALRIYEGASEVQRLIIGREAVAAFASRAAVREAGGE